MSEVRETKFIDVEGNVVVVDKFTYSREFSESQTIVVDSKKYSVLADIPVVGRVVIVKLIAGKEG